MRSVFSSIFTSLLLASNSWAALATDASKAVSFFRNKNSLFPSGQVSRTTLEAKVLRSETEVAYRTSWDKNEYVLKANQILRDIHVSRFADTKESVTLLSVDRSDAPPVMTLKPKTTLEIISTDDYWAKVKEKSGTGQGWLPLHHLQPRHDDLGVYVNIIETSIRSEPDPAAKKLKTLPQLQRIIPLEITKNFLKIQYDNTVGYVDVTSFVSRADFANLAYHPKKNWMTALYRNNDVLITQKGEVVPLTEILGYITNNHRGIVIRPSEISYGPPLRARVEIIKPEAYVWAISKLDGHGEVWWKRKNLLIEEKEDSPATVSTDTLMKREIYSIAFENKNSVRGLVSSEGVYRTEDGITWTLIPQFGKQTYPVSIHPDGTWFVGPFKSTNQGKSFEPFIRWDNIAEAIEAAYHRNPKIMRLTRIEALPNSKIQIHVDTGISKVKLRSSIGSTQWDVIKN